MRWMMTFLAALLLSAPLTAQQAGIRPLMDPRLRVEFAEVRNDGGRAAVVVKSRLSLVQWMLLGSAVGCVAGAVALSAGHDDDREKPPLRMQGCILGGSVGGFAASLYGLAAGARGP